MKALVFNSKQISLTAPGVYQSEPVDLAPRIQAVMPGYSQLPAEDVQRDFFIFPEKIPLTPTRRLVVLVPPDEFHEHALARRIWQLAACSGFNVVYLALSLEADQIAYQRRRLAFLASSTSCKNIHAQSSVIAENSWFKALDRILRPGDMLVCMAGHQINEHIFRRRELSERLAEGVKAPVYILGGISIHKTFIGAQLVRRFLAWGASLTLIALFFGLQVWIDRSVPSPFSLAMIILSILAEVYLLLRMNEWIS